MNNLVIEIDGTEYDLAITLRVAYVVQGQHNHKPYTEIFQSIGKMTLEEQIDIIYASFKVANPDKAKIFSSNQFLEWCLDNMPLTKMSMLVKAILMGIMGKDSDEDSEESKN